MRPRHKRIFWGFVAVLWAVLALAGTEAVLRYRTGVLYARAQDYHDAFMKDYLVRWRPVIERAQQGDPDHPLRELPPYHTFYTADAAACAAMAEQLGAAVLRCARDGAIRGVQAVAAHGYAGDWARTVTAGQTLADAMPEAQARDAKPAVRAALNGQTQWRHYPFPRPGSEEEVLDFLFVGRPAAITAPDTAVILVRPSLWKKLWARFRPNVHRRFPFELSTNRFGFRADDVAVPKPDGVVRLACVGASTTFEGPTNAWTYPNRLKAHLRERLGTRRVEVVNCGLPAVASSGELALLDDVLALQPDFVLHYNFINDLAYGLPDWLKPPADGWSGPGLRLAALLRRSRLAYQYFNQGLLPGEDELARRFDQAIFSKRREFIQRVRAAGATPVLCEFAYPQPPENAPLERAWFNRELEKMQFLGRFLRLRDYARMARAYNVRLRELCLETGALFVPVAGAFEGGLEYFNDMCHMPAPAIDRKAKVMAEALAEPVAARLRGGTDD